MKTFKELGLSNDLVKNIQKLGFTKPTQIQEMSIPHIMKGTDVIGQSSTGSGKTLAFGCGIIHQVIHERGIQAIVLTPTRELAEQVRNDLDELSNKKIRITAIYGGVSIEPQINELHRTDVVVATPGRLLDHLERRTINMSKVKFLVLDEADRMLDMGFIDDVEKIIKTCPEKRQTLFFSATISSSIKRLADRYMNKPVSVSAEKMVDPRKLKQVYYDVQKNMKFSLLVHLLKHEKSELIMVFCNTRENTDFVAKNLKINGINAIPIHGGLAQNSRTKTIGLFDEGKAGVLVCTDVAARGLHIENISHVYNYDIPRESKNYVHRIGRTARAGEQGKVINLLCDYEHDNFSRILKDYREFSIKKIEKPYIERVNIISTGARRHNSHIRRRRY
ncbi:MAG: DEAD/DEAH box helicase [Candidatus Aenigmarchaeota archaeon]|nr:DEAD/DEAH box helicase [Candidatus Aenigmarchaeota archaeon]